MNNHNIFLNLLYPIIIFGNALTITPVYPQIVQATSVYQVRQIAKEITVLIFTLAGSGSGIIIAKNGDEYWVLTAGHVVNHINPQEEADLQTYDGKIHLIDTNHAIVSFEQIVYWSLWPGLINGVTNTKLREFWEFIDEQWQIVSVEEVQSF